MLDWNRHNLSRALKNYFKLANEAGIRLVMPERKPPKIRRWSICIDSIDGRHPGCVSVLLPRWLSMILLWWCLPRKAFTIFRRTMIAQSHVRRH